MIKTLQGLGYLISTMSVVLLGAVAWESARDDANLLLALIVGVAASILGMLLRWLSFLQDQREKQAAAESAPVLSTAPPARSDPPARAASSGRPAGISIPSRS